MSILTRMMKCEPPSGEGVHGTKREMHAPAQLRRAACRRPSIAHPYRQPAICLNLYFVCLKKNAVQGKVNDAGRRARGRVTSQRGELRFNIPVFIFSKQCLRILQGNVSDGSRKRTLSGVAKWTELVAPSLRERIAKNSGNGSCA